ncbi:pyridine nucleotide-disulfide oxidoreductase [Chitinophaga parva]|uniref:Pyridine nucleotide-disulfide oxidoreductase n=1 Tax=Chitinophaga parva TaxID=2169414 RepID=A0A2T7BHG5_9BACT|nr:NAD(P)/FAD-dependent oxidoreductase [Chitinophaga parva]PUZ25731.1 pyridine nucleotide-disulfide oxidoreductase [Chitinophaga parva]
MEQHFEIIIIGGSYAGLQAALTLGRARKRTLVIDSGAPCNRFTPHSHNFLTHDGAVPASIAMAGRQELAAYPTVHFLEDKALTARQTGNGFEILTAAGQLYQAAKLVFATGIRDIFPDIPGFAACWGKTVIHCPFCHGYELRDQPTGVFGPADAIFDFSKLLVNWAHDIILFPDGAASFTEEQLAKLQQHQIRLVTVPVQTILQEGGRVRAVQTADGQQFPLNALYARIPFEQHCDIPAHLGCKLTNTGHLEVDAMGKTSVEGVFAAGDNTSPMRSVAMAVMRGQMVAAAITHDLAHATF